MQKRMMVVGAAIAVLVLAGVAFFLMSGSKKSSGDTQTAQTVGENVAASKSSIKSLLDKGENVTCSVKFAEKEMNGTVYVAGARVRGDFTALESGQSVENHMIQDGDYIYVWGSSNQGMKMKVDKEAVQASPTTSVDKPLDLDEQVEMDCDKWSVDEFMFSQPSGVTFTDVAEAMKSLEVQSKNAPKVTNDVCAQITDPAAKAACVAATGQ